MDREQILKNVQEKASFFYPFHSYIYLFSPKNHAFSLIQRIKPLKCFGNIPNFWGMIFKYQYSLHHTAYSYTLAF